jgi:uncharacterized RDD family membrane protein YckC
MSEGEVAVPRAARPYQGQPAGLVTRTIAALVDGVIVLLLLLLGYGAVVLTIFILSPREFEFPELRLAVSLLSFWIVLVVYLTLSWWLSGRSFGALLMGLRVVDRHRGRAKLAVALARAVVCALFPVGLLWVAVNPANRSVQDILFGTSVLYDWR